MTNTRPADVDPLTAAVNEAIGEVEVLARAFSDEDRATTGGDARIGDANDSRIEVNDSRIGDANDSRIGVACSGGADSIALAHATIAALGAARVVVLHIDHGLSPGSAVTADGVAAWAKGQGATAVVRRVTVEDRASIEAAARDARYAALADLADELELPAIFVGHTARDQAETVLMRILRGTGPAGLVGIPRVRTAFEHRCREDHPATDAPRIVRPLLAVSREDVDAYVASHALPTWADPMNDDPAILRVRIRDRVLPTLRHENPQLDAALVRLAASAAEWAEVIDALAAPFARWPIDCSALSAQPAAVRKRVVALALDHAGIDYATAHLDAIDDLVVRSTAGQIALDLPDARVVRTYDRLDLAPVDASTSAPLLTPAGYALRRWQPGDRMRPARLKGRSRKLSDLFIDAKVPRDVRSQARVLVRDDGVIVWAEHLGLAHGEAEKLVPRPPE